MKLSLQEATRPIQKLIFELAECKSAISFYQKLKVQHGLVREHYSDSQIKYDAEIRKNERDSIVKSLQKKIDQLQTEIDAHNANVEISIPDEEFVEVKRK